jgi:glutamyl-tRNA synthetase
MSAVMVTRFAPSPSGELHLGNVRTALFNWLLARSRAGRFLLRIEDSDAARSRDDYSAAILRDLRWLGLEWDEGPERAGPSAPYLQSQRGALYAAAFAQLERAGAIYPCFCTAAELEQGRHDQVAAGRPPRYSGRCRDLAPAQRAAAIASAQPALWRFRVGAGLRIEFDDLVHGRQSFSSADLDDFVVRRRDGSPAFFFCNAVDDAAMGVTHVLRGEDHLSNTPRQLLLFDALGKARPTYGHLALLLAADGAPLSKRAGAASLASLRDAGYLPAAILNLLFRLGHSSRETGFLDLEQMAAAFELAHLGRSGAHFDPAQLAAWQKEAVHRLAPEAAWQWLRASPALADVPEQTARALVEAVRANLVLPADLPAWVEVAFGAPPEPDARGAGILAAAGPAFFAAAVRALDAHGVDWRALVAGLAASTGRKGAALYQPLRYALTGRDHGPELAALLPLITASRARVRFARLAN